MFLYVGVRKVYVVGKEPAIAVYLARWYVVLVCHQYDVCKNYVGSVCVGGYPVSFLVVGKSTSVLFWYVIMSYVNCGDDV